MSPVRREKHCRAPMKCRPKRPESKTGRVGSGQRPGGSSVFSVAHVVRAKSACSLVLLDLRMCHARPIYPREILRQTQNLDPINRVSYLESRCYMLNTLLRDSDFMSMAHGLELRVPLIDHQVAQQVMAIPGPMK